MERRAGKILQAFNHQRDSTGANAQSWEDPRRPRKMSVGVTVAYSNRSHNSLQVRQNPQNGPAFHVVAENQQQKQLFCADSQGQAAFVKYERRSRADHPNFRPNSDTLRFYPQQNSFTDFRTPSAPPKREDYSPFQTVANMPAIPASAAPKREADLKTPHTRVSAVQKRAEDSNHRTDPKTPNVRSSASQKRDSDSKSDEETPIVRRSAAQRRKEVSKLQLDEEAPIIRNSAAQKRAEVSVSKLQTDKKTPVVRRSAVHRRAAVSKLQTDEETPIACRSSVKRCAEMDEETPIDRASAVQKSAGISKLQKEDKTPEEPRECEEGSKAKTESVRKSSAAQKCEDSEAKPNARFSAAQRCEGSKAKTEEEKAKREGLSNRMLGTPLNPVSSKLKNALGSLLGTLPSELVHPSDSIESDSDLESDQTANLANPDTHIKASSNKNKISAISNTKNKVTKAKAKVPEAKSRASDNKNEVDAAPVRKRKSETVSDSKSKGESVSFRKRKANSESDEVLLQRRKYNTRMTRQQRNNITEFSFDVPNEDIDVHASASREKERPFQYKRQDKPQIPQNEVLVEEEYGKEDSDLGLEGEHPDDLFPPTPKTSSLDDTINNTSYDFKVEKQTSKDHVAVRNQPQASSLREEMDTPSSLDNTASDYLPSSREVEEEIQQPSKCKIAAPSHKKVKKFNEEDQLQDSSDVPRAVKQFAMALQNFRRKLNSEREKREVQILNSVAENIQKQVDNTSSKMRSDLVKYGNLCKKRCKALEANLKDQSERLKSIQSKFKEELAQLSQSCDDMISQVEGEQLELKAMAEKQKVSHKKMVIEVQENIESEIGEAQVKIDAIHKASAANMQMLKRMLKEIV